MIILIYGDDISASRTYFIGLKQKYPDATSFDGQSVNITDLTQALEGGGLFTEEKTIIIEQLITKKKASSEFKSIVTYLLDQGEHTTIILWENKDLEKTTTTLFKGATLKQFKLPQSLFTFLENIRPGNTQLMLKLYHETLQTLDAEALFYMLVRHIRLLMALHSDGKKTVNATIDEVKRMGDWQKGKLQKQASFFTIVQLIAMYRALFDLEKGQKTSSLTLPLRSSIDIFLLDI